MNDLTERDDYYSQGYEKKGIVSIWVGQSQIKDSNIDVLHDLCGVGYYRLDDQESNCLDFQEVNLKQLLQDISYSASFLEKALELANSKGVTSGRWIVVQYDFEYDSKKALFPPKPDPIYIGSMPYKI